METITKYKAFDGREFVDPTDCELHETNCKLAEVIMQPMPDKPEGCGFSNGDGYLQHDKEVLLKVRNRFLEFARRYTDHKWVQQTIDKGFDADPSWAGRIIGECAPSTINKHWYRFMCIDNQCREWGQPYYATNPDKAKQIRLN